MAGGDTTRLEGIQACVFDAYGTLFNVATPVEKLAADIGEKASELGVLWRRKQLEYTWLRSLMGVHADFWHVTREALDYALKALAIEEAGLADELMTLYLKLEPFPDASEALAALRKKGRRTAILSNGSPSMLDSILRHAGLERSFDMVLSVEDVGIYKPSRRVYRLAMQKLGIQDAPSICFVSANTWDAQAAAHFGFQVVRVARIPTIDDGIPGKPARVVESLMELPELI
ncbi:MAG: haloacid dehalogenase type II [Proteobacteria bacterium]|nr:haloacid dehalogenase type II [Pseudomonadota bacterium]